MVYSFLLLILLLCFILSIFRLIHCNFITMHERVDIQGEIYDNNKVNEKMLSQYNKISHFSHCIGVFFNINMKRKYYE